MTKFKTNYMIFATFFSMLIMAITDSTKGILIPSFKDIFSVSDTTIGTFLLLGSLSYVASTYLGSILCSKLGQKSIIMLGMTIAGTAFLITSFSKSFTHIMVGYVVITIGIAFIAIGLNTLIPLVKVTYLGLLMNLLHFFYGAGSTITQRVTGYLVFEGISWRYIFIAYFGLYLLSFIVYAFVQTPEDQSTHSGKSKGPIDNKVMLVLFCASLGFYVAAEIQTANWLLNYLKEVLLININEGSFYVAFFFGIFSVGRLLGGLVVERFGYLKSVIISLSMALGLYTAGLILGGKALILVSVSGLFFAITFPTMLLVIQKTFSENATQIAGIATMSASLTSMIVGFFMGVLNDIIGPATTIYMIPLSLLISLGLAVVINVKIKSGTSITQSETISLES
ncbi:MFS transporter [Fusibacter sp. JL216-2]|uniref:MFS transporter n=1 Tax=Fusibacter sp. JL216-2 TaxID=3071453 RepID=UPI003D326FCD